MVKRAAKGRTRPKTKAKKATKKLKRAVVKKIAKRAKKVALKPAKRVLMVSRKPRSIAVRPKPAKPVSPSPSTPTPEPIGKIVHYYDKIGVGIVRLKAVVKLGELLKFKSKNQEFVQAVTSLQFDHHDVGVGEPGKDVGMKLNEKVKEGMLVFRAQ